MVTGGGPGWHGRPDPPLASGSDAGEGRWIFLDDAFGG